MAEASPISMAIILLVFLTTMSSQFHLSLSSTKEYGSKSPTGFSLKLIPADSPKSPLYIGNLTKHERMQRLIIITKARSLYLQHESRPSNPSREANSSTQSVAAAGPQNIQSWITRDGFYFAVHVGIGSPVWEGHLLMDTAGGLIWTQCEPCINCFPASYPMYDSRRSTTYSKLPCDHPLCQMGFYSCVNGQCVYDITYGGGDQQSRARTRGVASLERFVFNTAEGGGAAFDGVLFGCSNDNTNFAHFGVSGHMAGIMGLSLSPDSLLMQLSGSIERKYSYCIPTMDEPIQNEIVLSFGSDVPTPPNLQATPLVMFSDVHYFYLNLLDISVGNQRLHLPPGTFTPDKQYGTEGFFIDSGAPLTTLDQNARGANVYGEVFHRFEFHYGGLGLKRSSNSWFGFELCYEMPPGFNNFLPMTYHFAPQADYVVHSKELHYIDRESGTFCVTILPSSGGPSILGAWHHQNKQIIYDVDNLALHFATRRCPN